MKQNLILVLFIFCLTTASFSQQGSQKCKVLLKELSGTYSGGCKDGLAEGQGIAIGTDSYSGAFKKGLPSGNGMYKYKNGDVYTGSFKNGLKDGKGEYRFNVNGRDSIITGSWKKGIFRGKTTDEGYRVTSNIGASNYSIYSTTDTVNVVEISFERVEKTVQFPANLSVSVTSGYKSIMNRKIVVNGYTLPVVCSMHYTIMRGMEKQECFFDFMITKQGKWEVRLSEE